MSILKQSVLITFFIKKCAGNITYYFKFSLSHFVPVLPCISDYWRLLERNEIKANKEMKLLNVLLNEFRIHLWLLECVTMISRSRDRIILNILFLFLYYLEFNCHAILHISVTHICSQWVTIDSPIDSRYELLKYGVSYDS